MKKHTLYDGVWILLFLILKPFLIDAQDNHPLKNESSIWDSDEILINVNANSLGYRVFDLIDNCEADDCLEFRGNEEAEQFSNGFGRNNTVICNLTADRMQEVVTSQINTARTLRITVAKMDSINYSLESYSFIDIDSVNETSHFFTTGDLDNDGLDEILIVYHQYLSDRLIIRVYDTDGDVSSMRLIDELVYEDINLNASQKGVAASIGDFNMDNSKEACLIWNKLNDEGDSIEYKVSIINLDSLELITHFEGNNFSIKSSDLSNYELDVEAASFYWHHTWNDDIITPRDELAYLVKLVSNRTGDDPQQIVYSLRLLEFNEDLTGFSTPYFESDTVYVDNDDIVPVDLAVGLLDDDPDFDLVVYTNQNLKVYSLDFDTQIFDKLIDSNFNLNSNDYNIPSSDFLQVADLNADGKYEILIIEGTWDMDNPYNSSVINLNMYEVNEVDEGFELVNVSSTKFYEDDNLDIKSISITAGDFDGDRVRYGIPKIYTEYDYLQPIVVLGAPPTHFDIIDDKVIDLTGCYTGDCEFYSLFEKTRSETREISVEVRSDWAIDAKLSASLETKRTIGTKKKNISGSLKIDGYISGRYGESFTKVNNSGQELSIKVSAQAQKEDMVYGTIADYKVYEYPVYIDDSVSGYFTMVIPNHVRKSWFSSKSLQGLEIVDRHEVGNILSYTPLNIEDNPDIETFIDPGATQISYNVGPTSKYEWSLEFKDFQENQIKTQTDISYGFGGSVEASVSTNSRVSGWKRLLLKAFLKAISKVERKLTVKVEGNYENNSSTVTTHKVKVEEELLLRANLGNLPNGIYGGDYSIAPVTYWATNGALVLDYEVKPALSPQGYDPTWWQKTYSQIPDATFILPWKYDPEKNFALSSNDQRNFSKDIAIVNEGDIERGDTVKFIVRIHNYSFHPVDGLYEASFFMGDPDHGGFPILNETGENAVLFGDISSNSFDLIEFNWIVPKDFDICHPRIYVVLDPENELEEIHEDNNKAYTIVQLNNRDYDCVSYTEVFPSQNKVTALEDDLGREIGLHLEQNFPNPVSSTTLIKYSLPVDLNISMEMMDINGKVIKSVFKGHKTAGTYQEEMDLSDLPDGIYLYRLTTNMSSITKRMVLVH